MGLSRRRAVGWLGGSTQKIGLIDIVRRLAMNRPSTDRLPQGMWWH